MGVESYDRKALMNQRQEKGKRAFAARQTAAMTSRNRNSADEEQSVEDTGREKGIGFFGWLGGLFSEDIVFWFHETQIKGKSGRQVRGGAVPLFDGVILDLTPASMVGEAEGERQVVRPLEGGSQAKLIVSPARRGFTAEHAIHNFVITAPKNGKADGFSAEIREQITYDLGAGVQLQARGAAICEGLIVLDGASLTGVRGSGEIGGAVINEGGIMITPKADSESSDIKEKAQEALEQKPDENQSLESQLTEVHALEEKVSENKAAESGSSESGTTESTASENRATESIASKNKITESTAPENKPLEEKLSEERPTGDKEDAEDKKDEDDGKDGEDDEDDDGGDGTKITLNLSELAGSVESDGNKLAVNGKEGSVEFQKDDLEGNVNFRQKTFKISWGKDWSSEDGDEDEDESEDQEEKKKEETNVKEAIQKYYETIRESGEEVLGKTGFAKDALISFFKTGKLPENKYEKKEEENTTEVPLAQVTVIPGISFAASLAPLWSFGLHFDFSLEKEDMPDIEVTVKNGEVTNIFCPDIRRVLSLTAEAKGAIGATLRLALELGAGYIFSASGGLTATGKAQGIVDKSENVFGRGQAQIPLTIRKGEIRAENASLDLQAGIGIMGSVGADLSIGSKLFEWEKELWSYTFKEWNPANLSGSLKMKQNRKGEKGLFSPSSWEVEERTFSFTLFQKKIEHSKRYGLNMIKVSERAKILMEQGDQVTEKIQKLHEKLKGMQEEIANGGGQTGVEGNEAYEDLMNGLRGIIEYLNATVVSGGQTYDALVEELDRLEESEEYQSSRRKVNEKIDKHSKRYEKMKEWGEGDEFKGKEEERDKQAYSYYQETFQAKNAVKQQKDAREESAKRRLATRKRLIEYEEARMESLAKDYDERIKKLEAGMGGMSEDEKKKANPDFLESYKGMNGGGLFENWQQYAGKERIIAYEEGRRDKYKKKHTDRYNELEAKKKELNISDTKVPNRAFVEFYYKEEKARRFFSEEELLHNHQNGKEIVGYEEMRLEDKTEDYLERIKVLEQYKADYDKAQSGDKRAEILANARKDYQAAKGELGKKLQWHVNIAKSASKEDILAYETKKTDIDRNEKVPDDYRIAKRALEILKEKGPAGLDDITITTDKGKKENKKKSDVDELCRAWLSKNLKADSELLEEVTPLEVLYQFEEGRKNEIKLAIRCATITVGKKRDEVLEKKFADSEEYQYREKRQKRLGELIKSTGNMSGGFKESAIQDAKKKFFNEFFTGEEGKKDRAKLMRRLTQGSGLSTPELLRVVLERKLEEFGGSHKERAEKLRELIKPKEGQPAATDAQVWEEYRNMGGGRGFADYYVKEKGGNFTIDDMLRFERFEARAHSGKNAVKALVQDTVEEKVEKDGKEKVEKRKELAKGGHYERLNKLKAKLDGNAPDREIAELYIQLGGGAGYTKWLMSNDRFLESVTPQEILDYEQNWSGQKGKKHDDRLEKLKESGSGLSDEAFYNKYREMVLEESAGKNLLDKVIGYETGFDESVKAEDVLTPQILLKHEKKVRDEAVKKHNDRLKRLREDDVTDENALEIYRQAGGGRGFFDHESVDLGRTQSVMGASADFQNILAYEKERLENYEKAREELVRPLEKIKESRTKLRQQLKQAKIDIFDVEEMWDKFHVPGNQAYKSNDGFRELVDGTGPDIKAKADDGIAQVRNVSETFSQLEEHEFKQARNAQLELMLIEEDDSNVDQKTV